MSAGSGQLSPHSAARLSVLATVFLEQPQLAAISVLFNPILSSRSSLMRRRSATGAVMNTLIVELLHRELCQKDAMSLGELEKLFRSVIRSEGRALLREWSVAAPAEAVTESRVDSMQDEYLTDGDDEDDDDSLDMATAFCGNLV